MEEYEIIKRECITISENVNKLDSYWMNEIREGKYNIMDIRSWIDEYSDKDMRTNEGMICVSKYETALRIMRGNILLDTSIDEVRYIIGDRCIELNIPIREEIREEIKEEIKEEIREESNISKLIYTYATGKCYHINKTCYCRVLQNRSEHNHIFKNNIITMQTTIKINNKTYKPCSKCIILLDESVDKEKYITGERCIELNIPIKEETREEIKEETREEIKEETREEIKEETREESNISKLIYTYANGKCYHINKICYCRVPQNRIEHNYIFKNNIITTETPIKINNKIYIPCSRCIKHTINL